MWYEIPETKPKPEAPPPAIFPWEREHQDRPKATRKFAEDQPPEPPKSKERNRPTQLQMPPSIAVADDVFTPFTPQVNAWDANPSIERYVRAVLEAQKSPQIRAPPQSTEILSPSGRRESLLLTDFPSADDRPSLPVTPAPIRRPTFWGEERDEAGDLPAAEGVPDQAEWVCPQCGFSSDTPVAFYHAPAIPTALASDSATTSAQPQAEVSTVEAETPVADSEPLPPAAEPARLPSPPLLSLQHARAPSGNAWDDIPLPAHLRPQPKKRHSSSDFSFSSTSTAVGPSMTATAGPDDGPKLALSVPPVVAELRDAEAEGVRGDADEQAVITPFEERPAEPVLGEDVETAISPLQAPKQILSPPAWLTGPVTQR
jgi:glycogenin glucosyltransferase